MNKKKWQEEIEARDKDIRQKMEEQFGIHNFINKEKEIVRVLSEVFK